jgi:hypothetical protein
MEYINKDADVLVSILAAIGYKNPRIYTVMAAILSKIISVVDEQKGKEILRKIENKFAKIPNTGFLLIWLQRFTLKIDKEKEYDERLCQKVINSAIKLWNTDWLNNAALQQLINETSIIDEKCLEDMNVVIDPQEFNTFNYN